MSLVLEGDTPTALRSNLAQRPKLPSRTATWQPPISSGDKRPCSMKPSRWQSASTVRRSLPDGYGSEMVLGSESSRGDTAGQHSGNPYVAEKELRGCFNGIRIVGEIDLSQTGPVYEKAKEVVRKVVQHGSPTRLNQYPASTVIFLTAEGARGYDEGTFWPNIEVLDNLTAAQQSEVGRAFRSALNRLGLETFAYPASTEQWLTNVSPILMHGGIPATCANDVAELVYKGLRDGIWDADGLIDRARQSSSHWSGFAKPVQRFFEYGDEFARDLLQRMIDTAADIGEIGRDATGLVIELSADVGLPQYLTRALLVDHRDSPQRGRRTPRPTVRIDRYSCDGPYMTLPPFLQGGEWLIRGQFTRRFATRRHDSFDIQLAPAHGWTATLRWSEHSADRQTERHFAGLEEVHAYVFDASGNLMNQQHRLATDQVMILTPPGVTVSDNDGSPIPGPEELPPRTGLWSGWTLRFLDLTGVSAVLVKLPPVPGADEDVAVLRVAQSAARPEIATSPVGGCRGIQGGRVFAESPIIALPQNTDPAVWRVRWRPSGIDSETGESLDRQGSLAPITHRLVDLPRSESGFHLAPLLPSASAFSGTVEVSGPLGSDMREFISVVRGLTVGVPDRVFGPSEFVEVAVMAEAQLCLDDGTDARTKRLPFEAGRDTVPLTVDGTELTVTIPRLAWAIQRADGSFPTHGIERLRIGLDEIESGAVGSVLVRCGRPSTIRLELHGNTCLQKVGPVRASGAEGRWSFPLVELRTTIAASTVPRLALVLHVDDLSEGIAVIEAQFEVRDLQISTELDAETSECFVSAKWTENRQFTGRQLRFWSVHRPWDHPVCAEIRDDVAGRCDAILELLPGPYLAEVVVADEWSSPPRPGPGQAGVCSLSVGSAVQQQIHLESLRVDVPVDALELAVSGVARSRRLDVAAAATATRELICALDAAARFDNTNGTAVTTLVDLVDLVLTSNGLLPRLASSLVELPTEALRRLEIILVAEANSSRGLTDGDLEILWKTLPTAAAALDDPSQGSASGEFAGASLERWEHFSGWGPDPTAETVTGRILPVTPPLDDFNPERLRELQQALPPSDSLPLQWGGWKDAAFEMLERTWQNQRDSHDVHGSPDRERINRWRSSYHALHQYTQRFSTSQNAQYDLLKPEPRRPAWHNFSADILAAAFHLIDDTAGRADLTRAADALCDAAEIAPLLTTRNILLALGLKHVENVDRDYCHE